ncbi:MAG: 30S ribosomal protein S17 [Candidatus Aenigmarchaeota archaeon]|nr:30S ribosomal protein S17 [Candidatus Aenigmarchaeota archaeon]
MKSKQNIGVDAKPPAKACGDKKCCWHGSLPVRGRVFQGEVISDRASKTVVVKWGYNKFIPKYQRYERRNTTVRAYNPECIAAKAGDDVKIAECRPLSKTKSFTVVEKNGGAK